MSLFSWTLLGAAKQQLRRTHGFSKFVGSVATPVCSFLVAGSVFGVLGVHIIATRCSTLTMKSLQCLAIPLDTQFPLEPDDNQYSH